MSKHSSTEQSRAAALAAELLELLGESEHRAEDLEQSMRGARSSLNLTLRELVAAEQRALGLEQRAGAAELRISELESAHAVIAEREQRISQRAAAQSRELDRLTAQLRAEHGITAEERARANRAESRLEVLEVLLEAEKNITAGRELLAELATEESST